MAFLAFFLFQYAFADTCSTVTTGSMVGRTAFGGDLLYSVAVSGFIYPIFGHWVWGPGGWLATMKTPFHDFAGSTVVHSIGGFVALAGAIVLGPRIGRKFKRDGGGMPPGHDMAIAAVGGVILWFGWYGFNPGSTLSAMDFEGIGRVATNTTLAAAAAGLVAMFVAYPRSHKWDTGISINGFLAGLVAITCPCYWVSPFGAICIGAVAGVVVILGIDLLEYLRIDDPIGAWPVHGLCGMWGTWSLGLFATGQYGLPTATGADPSSAFKGLFYGGGLHQFWFQVYGSVIICAATFAVALIIMYATQGARCAPDLAGTRARGSRHRRARCACVSPRVRLHGLLADPEREVRRGRDTEGCELSVHQRRGIGESITCISSPQSSKRTASKQ